MCVLGHVASMMEWPNAAPLCAAVNCDRGRAVCRACAVDWWARGLLALSSLGSDAIF